MAPKSSYETSDLSFRAIAMALALLASLLLGVEGAAWLAVRISSYRATPVVVETVPPEPRLEVSPAQDLARLRRDEDALLKEYGWVDRQAGIARIPIDRAIDLVLKHGLPARAASREKNP